MSAPSGRTVRSAWPGCTRFQTGYLWINIQASEKLKSIDVSPVAAQNWSRAETIRFTWKHAKTTHTRLVSRTAPGPFRHANYFQGEINV